jgi:hypothetical protein
MRFKIGFDALHKILHLHISRKKYKEFRYCNNTLAMPQLPMLGRVLIDITGPD